MSAITGGPGRVRLGTANVSYLDLLLTAVASLAMVYLVTGNADTGHPTGGVGTAILALTMVLPLAFRRRWPLEAAAAVGLAAIVNGASITNVVRCGPALPVVALIAFACGFRLTGRQSLIGLAFCLVCVGSQTIFDPVLGPSQMVPMLPMTTLVWGAGKLVRSRVTAASELRARNAELREQREDNARLAVATDRAQMATELESFLHDQISGIAGQAAAGSEAMSHDPAAATAALASIEEQGRDTLKRMRSVVGGLKDTGTTPQPVLAQLDALLKRASKADTRLEVLGDPRQLPAGVELSAYRIVEHLLLAMDDDAKAKIQVTVSFQPNALELRISGSARRFDPVTTLAAVKERVSLHGGSVESRINRGRCDVFASLPVTSNAS